MKTINELLNELPEPYRTAAFENTESYMLSRKHPNVVAALREAFIWCNTPQGEYYWNQLVETLKENTLAVG